MSKAADSASAQLLCREYLEQDRLRAGLEDGALAGALLTEAELEASLQEALASPQRDGGGDVWLFAYGSLIWNPVLEYEERRVVTAHGWHRSFCLWSRINRGTPELPGLVLGLDRGGRCAGVAYRIAASLAERELRLLWRREMLLGSYKPRWVSATGPDTQGMRALAFVVNKDKPGYAGRLPLDQVAEIVCRATGKLGSGVDYVQMTADGLTAHGIRDPHILALDTHIRTRLAESAEPPARPQPER